MNIQYTDFKSHNSVSGAFKIEMERHYNMIDGATGLTGVGPGHFWAASS